MFLQRQNYFGRWSRTSSLLQFIDVYDKDSFIREYILDNVFVCIFMYILFYFAIWYAHKVIKRIEEKNLEMLITVEKNRTKLDDVIALRNKRTEYEDIVVKAKDAQNVTTKQLDNEMKRLSLDLITTMTKLNELEKFLGKMIFSGNFGRTVPKDQQGHSPHSRVNLPKELKLLKSRSRTLRYSSRRSHRRRHPSRRPASSESLQGHPYRLLAPHLRKSDSSNRASAETSSTESSYQAETPVSKYHVGQGDRQKIYLNMYSLGKSASFESAKKFPTETALLVSSNRPALHH